MNRATRFIAVSSHYIRQTRIKGVYGRHLVETINAVETARMSLRQAKRKFRHHELR
jgi:hypothetical protein